MNILQRPTTHCEDRPAGAAPDFIIIHYTETQDLKGAEDYFLGRRPHPGGGRVSTHYMIDEDGTVIQYVDESMRAWHAGVSHWAGGDDINSRSIGIELVNPGRKYGYRAFPQVQMDALMALARGIMQRHDISPYRVLGHSDVAPGRKSDPGELFDWRALAAAGLAVWPQPDVADREAGRDYLSDPQSLREAFTRVGYNPQAALEDVITAFQRHFCPESFAAPEQVGKADTLLAERLHWLVRHTPA